MSAARGAARYAARFTALRDRGEAAFVPFLVLGDPDPGTSLDLARALARSGADALELGLPFSDPIADGPVIQAGASRALAAGVRLADCWSIIAVVRREHPDLPIGLLVYANLVVQAGPARFYGTAAEAGVDSVLVADVPVLERERFHAAARTGGIAPILIAPPNASEERLDAIARDSEGYVYVVSRPGVTGADTRLRADSARLFRGLRARGAAPALLGFGVARPEHVRDAVALGADGVISGSAVVAHVPAHAGRPEAMAGAVADFAARMKAATRPPPRPPEPRP